MKWNDKPAPKQAKVYIAIPTHDGRIQSEVSTAFITGGETAASAQVNVGSVLTLNFNTCYAAALNNRRNGITHFLMMHSDIAVKMGGWCDKMVEIMEREGADVLSVAIPLKDDTGLTSTALEEVDTDNTRNPLGFKARKLTLGEIAARGKTWTAPNLLVNTGLMLVDIRKEWAENVCFRFFDDIASHMENGVRTFFPVSIGEDYNFSRDAQVRGAKLFVTTEIPVHHCGGGRYSNQLPVPTSLEVA